MTLATFIDANVHLDEDKVRFLNADDAEPEATAVDQLMRGMLFDVFGEQVSTWTSNDPLDVGEVATPEFIRRIAAMLMAAMRYEKKYALEDDEAPTHATRLREQAEFWLKNLREGDITLVESEVVSGIAWSEDDFWPNSYTVVEDTLQPDRRFRMDMEF